MIYKQSKSKRSPATRFAHSLSLDLNTLNTVAFATFGLPLFPFVPKGDRVCQRFVQVSCNSVRGLTLNGVSRLSLHVRLGGSLTEDWRNRREKETRQLRFARTAILTRRTRRNRTEDASRLHSTGFLAATAYTDAFNLPAVAAFQKKRETVHYSVDDVRVKYRMLYWWTRLCETQENENHLRKSDAR